MIHAVRQRFRFIAADFLSTNLAWCVFNIVRYYTLPYNYSAMSMASYYSMHTVMLGQLLFPIMMVLMFAVSGFYNNVYFKSRVDEAVNSFGISLIGSVVIFFIALFNDSLDDRMQNYEMVTILWLLISLFTLIPRYIISGRLTRKIENRQIYFNTIIVGTSDKARQLAEQLETKYRRMGLKVIGFATTKSDTDADKIDSLPVRTIDDSIARTDSERIGAFIIVDDNDMTATVETINRLFPTGKSIYITPDILHFVTSRPRTRMVSGEVLIDVSKSTIPQSTLNIKRIADIVISALALIILSPVLLVIGIMVRRSSPGGAIYKQQRVGLNKKPFNIYKFRSMYIDSEADGPALSSEHDPRITPIGHVLRKYRLDELPQFWNVLRGDMSLVGPRPERDHYLRQIIERAPYLSLLQQVRPGITSWGMVKFGYATSVDQMIERAKYDLLYIDNVSMIVDMKILFYTIETVLTGKGV